MTFPIRKPLSNLLVLAVAAALSSGCWDHWDDSCERRGTCATGWDGGTTGAGTGNGGNAEGGRGGVPEHGGASGSTGGGSAAGGASTAGVAGTGGNGGDGSGEGGVGGASGASGDGGAPPCDGKCGGTTPVCLPSTDSCVECSDASTCQSPKPACDTTRNACVECTGSGDCKESSKLFCDTVAQRCVACLKQSDCTAASASACNAGVCAACTTDAECSNMNGKSVCDAGTCVQCTGKKFAACGSNAGTPLVCDSLNRTCTMNKQHSSGLCKACVSDAQCNIGQLCAFDKYGNPSKDVGYFCHWKKGDTGAPLNCSVTGMPYVGTQLAVTSIDGTSGDICSLAVSTCVALNQFRAKDCTVAAVPSDAVCGLSPPKDAKCSLYDAGAGTYRCTMTCGSDDDCPSPFTCNTGVSPFVCNLN